MQIWIDNLMKAERAKTLRTSPQITLGELIRRLEAIPPTYEGRAEVEPKRVWFDFAGTYPVELQSWRGAYRELAITFDYEGRVAHRCNETSSSPKYPTAEAFLAMLRAAVGATLTGYKGGDFTMDEQTPVWVANHGDCGNTGVVGVKDTGYSVVIETGWCEF